MVVWLFGRYRGSLCGAQWTCREVVRVEVVEVVVVVVVVVVDLVSFTAAIDVFV